MPLFERALAIGTKALGADHVHVAMARNAYGEHLLRVGDLRGARKQLYAAHEGLRAAVPPDHPYVPMNRRLVAELLLREGNLDAAARIIDESVNALRRHRGLTLDLDRALAVQREDRARQASVR